MATPTHQAGTATKRPVRVFTLIIAAVFLAVGVLGFVPGVTTGQGPLSLLGHSSDALLLGVLQVSVLYNVVHLAFGAAGLVMWRIAPLAIGFLIIGGLLYLLLWPLGLLIGPGPAAAVDALGLADTWLRIALGVAMIDLGVIGLYAMLPVARSGARPGRGRRTRPRQDPRTGDTGDPGPTA